MATTIDPRPRPAAPSSSARSAGFVLALVIPMSGLILVGYEIGAIGAYGALAVWAGSSVVALPQNFIYAELAAMFPSKAGGIGLYASEIWSQRSAPLGGGFGWGDWAGSSLTLAVVSLVIGAALVILAGVCIVGPLVLGQLHFPLTFRAGHT